MAAVQTGCIVGVRKRTGRAVLCTGNLRVNEGYIFSKGQKRKARFWILPCSINGNDDSLYLVLLAQMSEWISLWMCWICNVGFNNANRARCFFSVVLTLMVSGPIVHAVHVRHEECTSAQANLPLTQANSKSNIEESPCVIRWRWGWHGQEVVAFVRNKISLCCVSFSGVEWFRPVNSTNLCTMHWVCMKADFLQKLSSEDKEGKTECQSPEVIYFITYQQLLQEVYCSGKNGFEANFWRIVDSLARV